MLRVEADDPDHGPGPLTYAWSTSGGMLSNTNTANPTLACPSAGGDLTIQLTVSDSVCADHETLLIQCRRGDSSATCQEDTTFQAEHGTQLGSYASTVIPAGVNGVLYTLSDGKLSAREAGATTATWTFGDGSLTTAPLRVGAHVVVGRSRDNSACSRRMTARSRPVTS